MVIFTHLNGGKNEPVLVSQLAQLIENNTDIRRAKQIYIDGFVDPQENFTFKASYFDQCINDSISLFIDTNTATEIIGLLRLHRKEMNKQANSLLPSKWNKIRFSYQRSAFIARGKIWHKWDQDWHWLSSLEDHMASCKALTNSERLMIYSWIGLPDFHPRPWLNANDKQTKEIVKR